MDSGQQIGRPATLAPGHGLDPQYSYEGSLTGGGSHAPAKDIRLAELLAAMSLATDLGNGFLPETAIRSSLLVVQLGKDLGLSGTELSDIYYHAGSLDDTHLTFGRANGPWWFRDGEDSGKVVSWKGSA